MTILQAIFLGALQGLAEFLPISSSGHLAIAEAFLGHQDTPILFDILLHIATLGAVITIYSKRILHLIIVLYRFIIRKTTDKDSNDLKFILSIIIATIITGVLGITLKDIVKNIPLNIIPLLFIFTGIILILTDKTKSLITTNIPALKQSLIVGFAQGLGVFPGISRSGITISAAIFSKLDRNKAGEFSFILSIPAIIAALMLELTSADNLVTSMGIAPIIAGMITAFIIGIISLKFLIKLINTGKFSLFSFYLIPLGIGLFLYFNVII